MELEITKSDIDLSLRYGYSVVGYTLNMTVLEAFQFLKAKDNIDFYDKIESIVADENIVIIPSEKDVEDFRRIDTMLPEFGDYQGSEDKKFFYFNFCNFIINLPYFDIPFEHEGKWGLRSITGIEVVPPLFESCKGAGDMTFCNTLAVVRRDGKYWLTPRDDSGRIVTAEGYDSISRSYCFAWVYRGNKCGVLNALTGSTLVPCEMDWMVSNSFIGKGNYVGKCFLGVYNGVVESTMTEPIYDAINISTGQFQLNGKWGWVLVDGTFTEIPPKSKGGYVYISQSIPLNQKAKDRYYGILSENKDKIKGVKKIRAKRYDAGPVNRMNLPKLSPGDIDIPIHPMVEEFFYQFSEGYSEFTIRNKNCQPISIKIEDGSRSKYRIIISWKETDQMDMAVDMAFPLINACHRIVRSENGRYTLTLTIIFEVEDFGLPKAFLSALLNFKIINDQLLNFRMLENLS